MSPFGKDTGCNPVEVGSIPTLSSKFEVHMGKVRKHKRKGPKSARSGCLMCKPHKRQGVVAPTRQERKAILNTKEQTMGM